ncbi:MAG: hypothetical protein HND52_15325 [Ignavibacteriae bacterium]|nr:hypothetical protein [Ignavibacteriota bacterium]NOG99326.1 hypothetical protein [Ignavibacteriota bacterium]
MKFRINKLLVVTLILVTVNISKIYAQWTYTGSFPNDFYKGGTHGIAVDPNGKIWTSSYFQSDWISPHGDVIKCSPIFVFSSDGAPIDTIGIIQTGTGTSAIYDTLGKGGSVSGCRGLEVDENGNIIYVRAAPSQIFKINYITRQGIARKELSEIGGSPTSPSVALDGTIFVGPVIGGGSTALCMYDTDLNFIGNAVLSPPGFSRTLEVSDDGNSIYWMSFFPTSLRKLYLYQRLNKNSAFTLVNSLLEGMSIESSAWHPTTGNLWVSHDSRGSGPYTHLTWYAYDVMQETFIDSFSLTPSDSIPFDEFPRGLDFSPNGQYAYVGLFGIKYSRIQRFEAFPLPVELVSFTASVDKQNIHLQWETATELNTYKFIIERRKNSIVEIDWINIGEINAAGNSNSPKAYEFIDSKQLLTGNYLYRLRIIDNDGSFEFSNPLEINLNFPKVYRLDQNYPNPFNPITKIQYSIPAESKVKIELYNVVGERVRELLNSDVMKGTYELDVNLSNFSSSVFIYRMVAKSISGKNNFSATRKMILVK